MPSNRWSNVVLRIIHVKAKTDWVLEVRFSDGTQGVVSLKDRLFGPVFEPLKDPLFFSQVRVDEFGAVCWPNGADLAPDALYEKLKSTTRVA
jgi:Protein of unknown function (DUF2442)